MYKNSDALLYIFREPGETNQSKRALKSNSLMFSQQEIFLRQNWMNVKIKEELFWEKPKQIQTKVLTGTGSSTSLSLWKCSHWRKEVLPVEKARRANKLRNSASSFHWLSSSIFTYSLSSFVVGPASVAPPLISTIWCFRPHKSYIFCEDMILATCQCQHMLSWSQFTVV